MNGTSLRSEDARAYSWPHPDFCKLAECEEPVIYDGLTTVLGTLKGGEDYAQSTWTAQEAQRLHVLAMAGENVYRRSGSEWNGQRFDPIYESIPAKDLILDKTYLQRFPASELRRTADRGTVLHKLMDYYASGGEPLSDADIKHWVDDVIGQGDGSNAYRCDPDETTGYCVSYNQWVNTHNVTYHASEVCGLHKVERYGCTLDQIATIGDDKFPSIIDGKSRGSSKLTDALQLVAQSKVTHLANPETGALMNARPLLRCAALRQMLVTESKVVIRTIPRSKIDTLWKVFKSHLRTYKILNESSMFTDGGSLSCNGVFETEKAFINHTSYKGAKSA
jgi:hypothetical protein